MSAALWKEAEGSNEVKTDLIIGKFQHSQQVFTHWKVSCTQSISGWVQAPMGGSMELEHPEPCEFSQLTRTPFQDRVLHQGETSRSRIKIEQERDNRDEGKTKAVGEGFRSLWLRDSSTTTGEKRILSSHAFHIAIRENLSKKCSCRFIRESHQPELEHTPMPAPITAKGNETPWWADTSRNSPLKN